MRPIDRLNYYNDKRTHAKFRTQRIRIVKQRHEHADVEIDLGDTTECHSVITSFGVCPVCRGRGRVIDPMVDASGLTSSDFDDEPGLRSAYFGGDCSISCPECRGKRVTIDLAAILEQLPSETQIQLTELYDEDEAHLRMQMAELAFGC